jgi:hypothetical protein
MHIGLLCAVAVYVRCRLRVGVDCNGVAARVRLRIQSVIEWGLRADAVLLCYR